MDIYIGLIIPYFQGKEIYYLQENDLLCDLNGRLPASVGGV